MKKTSILFTFIIWGLTLSAQVSLENTTSLTCPTDQSYIHSYVHKNTGFSNIIKHLVYNDDENSINIYNLDHSLYKSVVITPSADGEILSYYLYYSSQKLFNDDENIEFIIGYFIKVDSGNYWQYILYDENGTVLYDFAKAYPGGTYISNKQFYLTTDITDKTDATNKFTFKTYLLGGTPDSSTSNNEGISEEITELKDKINALEGSLASLKEKVNTHENHFTTLNEEQLIQNTNIEDLTKNVNTNEDDISRLQEDVNQLKDDVADIQHNMNNSNGTTTSIDPQKQNLNLSTFPNPASDYINIGYKLSDKAKTMMNIYNAKGQLIDQKQLNSNENTLKLNVSSYKSGMYLYEYNGVSNKFIVN